MNRIDRLSAIIVLLQTKKTITASQISERFNISLRTVYRDMRALNEAGIPIGAEAGKGYYLVDGYHLPPVMFTPEEAGAMLIADKLIEKFSDESVKNTFNLAIDKIKSVMPETHKTFLENVSPQILVLANNNIKNEYSNNHINNIQKALSEKKSLTIEYYSNYNKKINNRIIEPVGLCFYGYQWHLIAFCKLRSDYRDFRLDRIIKLDINYEIFSYASKYTLKEYFDNIWQKDKLKNAIIGIDKKDISMVLSSRHYYGYYDEEDKGSYVEMKFIVDDYAYILYWILSLGSSVISIKPEELYNKTIEHIKNLANQYSLNFHK